MINGSEKRRMIQYDVLRVIAAFSVVMLHSAAQFWYSLDIYSSEWMIANSYDAVFRFGVPIFVMISGALFLDRDYQLDIRRLYRHNILRMVILYAVWSCIYGVWDCRTFDLRQTGIKPLLRELIMGRYHLWFLPMLIGIYMLLPVLKEWIDHAQAKTIRYFLVLFFVFQIGSETLRALTVTDELHYILNLGQIEMACSYVGYFIWGYYLAHIGISEKLCRLIYISAVPSALCNILVGNWLAHRSGGPVGAIYDSFGIFTCVIATALYLVAVNYIRKVPCGKRSGAWIRELASDTLGIYVLHILVMEFLEGKGIHCMLISNIIGIPLLAILVFAVCFGMAFLLRRIPVIGKYIC